MSASQPIAMKAHSGISGPYPSPPAEVNGYSTWADNPGVSIVINGIDARTALYAMDLLRKKNPMYKSLRPDAEGILELTKHLFELEFGCEMPPPEMAIAMGARHQPSDAECMVNVLRNMSAPY